MNDPSTKYFIDESNSRMVFFNEANENRALIIFNPEKNADGHFGTVVRANIRNNKYFDKEVSKSADNMVRTPEIRSVADGGHIEHLEKFRTQLENVPSRVLGKGDLRSDFHQAGDMLKIEPLAPLDYNAPNAPTNKLLGKNGGTIAGVAIGTGIAASHLEQEAPCTGS